MPLWDSDVLDMISVIISSADPTKLSRVSANIARTIGVEYQLIAFDNGSGEVGLCSLYNSGAEKAKYNLLCFVHEDVVFHTQEWGKAVIDHFSNTKGLGLLGVAGSAYKSMAPSSWWHPNKALNCEYINILQGNKGAENVQHHLSAPLGNAIPQVAVIDGVWMCTTREIAMRYPFDEKLLKGFHGYDLDFSLSIGQHYKVMVSFDVLLEHQSEGHYSHAWLEDTLRVHHKWAHHLPLNFLNFDEHTLVANEKTAFKNLIDQMSRLGLSKRQMFATLIGFPAIYRRYGYGLFFSLLVHLMKLRTKR